MPSITSSTRSGTELVLFASERRTLKNALVSLRWIADHAPEGEAKIQAALAFAATTELLKELPEAEKDSR